MPLLRPTLLVAALFLSAALPAQAGLLGNNVTVDYNYLVPAYTTDVVTVTAGIEITCTGGGTGNANLCSALTAPNQYLDIGDSTISYQYTGSTNGGFNPVTPNGMTFHDLDVAGALVNVALVTDISGLTLSRVSFTDSTLTIELGGLSLGTSGGFTLTLTVPEPGGLGVLATLLGGLGLLRRRRA